MEQQPENRAVNRITSIIFYLSILLFIIGFNFSDRMAGNWYQQFMPNLNGRQIKDITFVDSLTGFAITSLPTLTDTAFILKTTNSGDNWFINHRDSGFVFNRINFLNNNTGFAIGTHLTKTTNGGINWNVVSSFLYYNDMHVISNDTIFAVKSESLTGGVFRTTNGGINWDQQLNLGSQNPGKIYMYNGSTGYITKTIGSPYIRKTTDSGVSWNIIVNGEGYRDIYFADINTGWRGWQSTVYKTTNSGINWTNQAFPNGGNIITSGINEFGGLNRDTIYGVGGEILVNSQTRGIIYRTINGGQNWTFQIPDTSINVPGPYNYLHFTNSKHGWAYTLGLYGGIHTTNGGDPIWITGVEQISSEIPREYILYQNYPNPFNPETKIKYSVKHQTSNVKLIICDIQGKQVELLVNQKQNAGTYAVDFSGNGYSSGVYFYSLLIGGVPAGVKTMILLK